MSDGHRDLDFAALHPGYGVGCIQGTGGGASWISLRCIQATGSAASRVRDVLRADRAPGSLGPRGSDQALKIRPVRPSRMHDG